MKIPVFKGNNNEIKREMITMNKRILCIFLIVVVSMAGVALGARI